MSESQLWGPRKKCQLAQEPVGGHLQVPGLRWEGFLRLLGFLL